MLLWIGRDRLLRPCPDPEPDDRNCTREPTTSKLEIGAGRSYRDYYLGLFESSYRVEGAPWTRLGYTYDWNSKSPERGASEFIALPGTSWEVEAVATPDEYCKAER